MKIRTLQEIITAYKLGDHITDAEMVQLRDTYHDVTVATVSFGKLYELVSTEEDVIDLIRCGVCLDEYGGFAMFV